MVNFSNKLNSLLFNLINQVIQAVDPLLVLMNRILQFPPVTGEKAKQLCALCSILYMEVMKWKAEYCVIFWKWHGKAV